MSVYVCVFVFGCVGSCACACIRQRSHVFDPITTPMSTFISCHRDDVRTFYWDPDGTTYKEKKATEKKKNQSINSDTAIPVALTSFFSLFPRKFDSQ